ncbi:Uncharacterised protein [Segatella copri]|nr:Uncharacterised protein [Segatella copri]
MFSGFTICETLTFFFFFVAFLVLLSSWLAACLLFFAIVMLPYFKRLNIFNAKIHIMDERYKEIVEN